MGSWIQLSMEFEWRSLIENAVYKTLFISLFDFPKKKLIGTSTSTQKFPVCLNTNLFLISSVWQIHPWCCPPINQCSLHYNNVMIGTIASQITSLTIVYSTVYSDADQRKHQSSTSLAFYGDRWIPRTNGHYRGKCFHLMTSSCDEVNSIRIQNTTTV